MDRRPLTLGRWRPIALLVFTSHAVAPSASTADELKLGAAALVVRGVGQGVTLTADGGRIELQRGELFEDDGPAAGYSYKPNEERLSDSIWIKKTLIVSNPAARRATLMIGGSGRLAATVNGRTVELVDSQREGAYWQGFSIAPDLLRSGANEFVLRGEGKIWIARDDEFAAGSLTRARHPNRSAKSGDGGQTWNDSRLGTANDVNGEYYLRLFLDHYRPTGTITLPIVDLGNLDERQLASPLSDIGPVRIAVDADLPERTALRVRARTGSGPLQDDSSWSAWQTLVGASSRIEKPVGRYFQIELQLTTSDPLTTPALRQVTISANPRRPDDWTRALQVVESQSGPFNRSSIPFRYEPLDHPKLKRLRETFRLDEVVNGAATEFELVQRLAAWSAARWDRGHLGESYPPWDALEILQPHADGSPIGGFCQQYNLVFLQACESFGLTGRVVSIGPGRFQDRIRGGHETTELWSNEFQKWIYIDGNTAWCFVDAETRIPLSLLELRERQLAAFRETAHHPVELIRMAPTKYAWTSLEDWPPFVELRMIPRSNFLEDASPLPLNQGMRGWFWTGHYVWNDDLEPAALLYGHRISKRTDWEWPLNQTHMRLTATTSPGEVQVWLDTHTPGFDKFVGTVDGADEQPINSPFVWKLKPGANRLQVRARNIAGRFGPPSWIALTH